MLTALQSHLSIFLLKRMKWPEIGSSDALKTWSNLSNDFVGLSSCRLSHAWYPPLFFVSLLFWLVISLQADFKQCLSIRVSPTLCERTCLSKVPNITLLLSFLTSDFMLDNFKLKLYWTPSTYCINIVSGNFDRSNPIIFPQFRMLT